MSLFNHYPNVKDPHKVGTYDAYASSGGGYFYDDVLEYRVWVHPISEEPYFKAFAPCKAAISYSKKILHAERPLVLVYQKEHIDEPKPGKFVHVKKERITEWQLEWLKGNRDSIKQIPIFLAKHSKRQWPNKSHSLLYDT